MAACKSCGAPVVWVETEARADKPGRRMPLDADRHGRALVVPGGNVLFTPSRTGAGVPIVRVVATGQGKHSTHFATCPHAKGHRR